MKCGEFSKMVYTVSNAIKTLVKPLKVFLQGVQNTGSNSYTFKFIEISILHYYLTYYNIRNGFMGGDKFLSLYKRV